MSLGITQFQKGETHDVMLSFKSHAKHDNVESNKQSKVWYMLR